jgi:hypothetical protein
VVVGTGLLGDVPVHQLDLALEGLDVDFGHDRLPRGPLLAFDREDGPAASAYCVAGRMQ